MRVWYTTAVCLALAALGCEGPAGQDGFPGPQGVPGTPGDDGQTGGEGGKGEPGEPGEPGQAAYLTGPGLQLTFLGVLIENKKVKVTFRLADGADVPLDREGKLTQGAVTVRMSLAWLAAPTDGVPGQYTSYTTRDQTSPITGVTAKQGAADEGGTFTVVDAASGIYQYELGTEVDVTEPNRTHTLGIWAQRDFEDVRYSAEVVHHFVPAGSEVNEKRDVVRTDACNQCHGTLKAHEGARRSVELCITCHSAETIDPDTGNTVDMTVMIHKIHRGKNLPSVQSGTPYQIIGFMQGVHDYSTVGYPQELQRCETCHTGAQAELWKELPTRARCASCHDATSFVEPAPDGQTLHAGGAQPDDSKCTVCHPPVGGLAGVTDKHLTPLTDPASPKIEVLILSVEKTAPGESPEIVFSVTQNGAPLDILATPMARLSALLAGPSTDYAAFTSNTIQGSGATGTLTAEGANFRYKMATTVPVMATGSYAVGMEGYIQPGGATGPRFATKNPVKYVAVTDPAPVPRREVVDGALCNSCHYKLQAHGGLRNNPEYCVLCHNPNQPGDERIERFESSTVLATSLDMRHFIHRIHTGEELEQQPYILGGNPTPTKANPAGTPIDFGEVRFPGDRKACWSCHKADSYMLPLQGDALLPSKLQTLTCVEDPAADADAYCDNRVVQSESFLFPETSACTGCHDGKAIVAHAETNTTASGAEACATCHGPGQAHDVQLVHQPSP